MSARSRAGSLGLMKARCLYEPARVLFGRWGRLVPRVSFSSDVLGMPWEFMGVYIFFRKNTLDLVLHRPRLQHLVEAITRILPYCDINWKQTTTSSAINCRSSFPTNSRKEMIPKLIHKLCSRLVPQITCSRQQDSRPQVQIQA